MESVKNLVIATLVTVAVGITFAGCVAKEDGVKTEEATPVATKDVKVEEVPVEEVKTEETEAEEAKTEETKAEEAKTEEVKAE